MHVRDILSRPVVAVRPDTLLREATAMLVERGFAALPVVDDAERVVGLLSESDALAAAPALRAATVEAVMSSPAKVVAPGTDVSVAAARMLDHHIRSMPVVEEGILVGIVSRRDLLRTLIHDDDTIAANIRALLDDYAGSRRQWAVEVADGQASIRGWFADPAEERVLTALARTVGGVRHVDVIPTPQ